MVEMLLGSKVLQYWQQSKSQVMGLPMLGFLDEDEEQSSVKEEEDYKKKKKRDERQSSTTATTLVRLTKDTYNSSICKFMCY
eukprot:12537979-Ditylum_brightwellii.AAC.1